MDVDVNEPIDISLAVSPDLPRWPGNPEVHFDKRLDLDRGDPVTDTTVTCSVHTGTHVDAPSHFLPGAGTVEGMSLSVLLGPAYVARLDDVVVVTAADLERAGVPDGVERLLLRTRNSEWWSHGATGQFRKDFVGLEVSAAQWVVDRGIGLIGIDYLSIQRFDDSPLIHTILLEAAVVIVEGLDLSKAEPGHYDLCCLPIKLQGAEGAPARAVLWKHDA